MKSRYQDEILGSLHETAEGLHRIGLLSDQEMQGYDHDCLVQKKEVKQRVKAPFNVRQFSHATA